MAYNLTGNINVRNRDNTPGNAILYLAEYDNVSAITLDSNSEYISDITMSGSTKFYKYEIPRENLNWENNSEISVPNGVYIFQPLVKCNIPGISLTQWQVFDVLIRKDVIAIMKTNEGKYIVAGIRNGLSATSNTKVISGNAGTDLIGIQLELQGLEPIRMYEIDPDTAETIMSGIVSAS